MNLGEFRTAVNYKTGIAVLDAALNAYVNEAVQSIGAERDWPWLDAVDSFTATGDAGYNLPADWARTRAVSVGGFQAQRVNIADADTYGVGTWLQSSWNYTIENSQLVFYPAPASGQAIIHRYVAIEPDLSADSDEPLLDARFHQAVVAYASAVVCDRSADPARADQFRQEYARWLRRMLDATSRSQQPSRIRIRPGAVW